MKLENVKVFVVGNPPPGYGGRYFVFLKLRTACGIEGVGEVYAATFGPNIIASMIEDVFARHFVDRNPFHIEALWRECHGTGFTLRPDLSLMSVVSGLEMACWDIIGKSVDQPVYQLLGGRVDERLAHLKPERLHVLAKPEANHLGLGERRPLNDAASVVHDDVDPAETRRDLVG